jgi:ABC-2 type transport system permease protein
VTAAINYVVEDERQIIYTMTGQGEQDLGSNFQSALETDNYDIEELNIIQTGGIPSDCALLVINAPSSDLDTSIVSMIDEYMENDGKLFVVLDPNDTYPNLNAMLAEYDVQVEDGIVLETGDGYYMGSYPTYLLPTLASHDITTPISTKNMSIVAPVSKGLTAISDDSSDYTVTDLLVTSSYSFSKVDTSSSSIEQTDDDIAGPLAVAQVVDNADGDGVLFVSGCSSMAVDEIDNYVSNANTNLYSNAVNYLTQQENKISIKAPVVTNNYAVFSAFATKMVLAIGIVGIPLFLLVLGVVVVLVRRNN